MLNVITCALGVMLLVSGVAGFVAPPHGCRLKVINSGTQFDPNYETTTCQGECVSPLSDPCTVDYQAGNFMTSFNCLCNGTEVDWTSNQACVGWLSKLGTGPWEITCSNAKCVATCRGSALPGVGAFWACTCPDV